MVPPGFPLAKGFEQYVDILKQFGPLAEENGVTMPSFFGYMAYSCGILLPLFAAITLLFF